MTNNDIIRRIRYAFDYNDPKMCKMYRNMEEEVSIEQMKKWLHKETRDDFEEMSDVQLATFLDGLIIENRGRRDGPLPVPEDRLNNNIIFRKLRIALNLKDTDLVEIMALADFKIGKTELSAFFRKPTHQHYRVCKDQVLRNFIYGLQDKYRPTKPKAPIKK